MKIAPAIVLGLLLSASASYAQLQQGSIAGKVVGPDGLAIARADVTLVDQLGNPVTSVVAVNGEFRITNIALGN